MSKKVFGITTSHLDLKSYSGGGNMKRMAQFKEEAPYDKGGSS